MLCERKLSILQCPVCSGSLSRNDERYLICTNCKSKFPIIHDIIIFLTKNALADFLGEAWGSELQKENAMFYPGYTFASNEDALDDLEKIAEEATRKATANQWIMTNTWPDNEPSFTEENREAIKKSRHGIIDLSRAACAKRILDWPTGSGYCLTGLVTHADPQALVVALDIDFRRMASIKPYYDAQDFSDNMLFIVADARNMPFIDGAFQAVTAWGGTTEIENADSGFRETYRVLEVNGWFGVFGDQYKEDSPSMKIAEQIGLHGLLTHERLDAAMQRIGFRNLEYDVLYEGYEIDDNLSDEERCPLPARGDWFQLIVAAGQKG